MSGAVHYSESPLLASRTPVGRGRLVLGVMALAFLGLAGRAAWVQVVNNDFFRKQGEVRFARTLELPANRGRVLDRNGLILASSVPAPSIFAIPEDVQADATQIGALARLLQLPVADLKEKLTDTDRGFIWLRRQVDDELAQQVETLGIKGVYLRKEYRRQYPEGEAAAHVVGFTDIEDVGQEGVELAFQSELAGRPGTRRVYKDRLGRVVEDAGQSVPPVDGRDLHLSIDSKIQFFAWQKLREAVQLHKARAGSVVVLDSASGEVLALANYPTYNPARRQSLTGAQLRNRALTDTFEPGSTMKPFIAALALQKKLVTPDTPIQTAPGRIVIGGSTISDSHPHGVLSVAEVIQKSSNVGTVKLAMQMQPREMWELYSAVGFGRKPQLDFPGTVAGRLRAPKTWRPIEQATMSYGYGLSTSLVQLARAYTVFARDGDLAPLSLVKTDGEVIGTQVISPDTARAVRDMLRRVTQSGGTAPQAQTMGYSVGGKTGTARKQEGRGYADRKYRGFFVGLAPIEKPRIVVAVMIDEPTDGKYFGGDVAAPVFAETVAQTLRMLGVQPDMAVKPQIYAEAVEESF